MTTKKKNWTNAKTIRPKMNRLRNTPEDEDDDGEGEDDDEDDDIPEPPDDPEDPPPEGR